MLYFILKPIINLYLNLNTEIGDMMLLTIVEK